MTPTSPRTLVAAAAIAGVLTYLLLRVWYGSLPPMPAIAVVSLVLIAVVEWVAAVSLPARLDGRPGTKPIHPIAVARTAALAKASSLAGALAAGGWAAVVAVVATDLDKTVPRHDAVVGLAGIIASLLLVAAALRLESVCRVKPPPDDEAAGSAAPSR